MNKPELNDIRINLQRQIDATYKQINQLMYALYGLTDEEIVLVEKT